MSKLQKQKFWVCVKHGIITIEEDLGGVVQHRRLYNEWFRDFKLLTEEVYEEIKDAIKESSH